MTDRAAQYDASITIEEGSPTVRNLPAVAYVCITMVILAFIASITYLTATGADTTEVRQTFNTLANFGGLIFGGVAAVGGTVAARNAQQAAHQTNGGLDARIEAGVQRALNARTGGSLGTEPDADASAY